MIILAGSVWRKQSLPTVPAPLTLTYDGKTMFHICLIRKQKLWLC